MKIKLPHAIALAIDEQERLLPAIQNGEETLRHTETLLKGLRLLDIPILITQQYTKGLGIMDSAAGFGAEMLITACPLCLYNLNKSGNGKLPVHYFTELLAEALGVKEEALQTLTSDKEVAE